MGKHTYLRWSLTVAATLALQACGGGGGGSPSDNPGNALATPANNAHAQGTVYDADTGLPLAGVTLQIDDRSVTTDRQGQFDLATTANRSLDVHASLNGYADGQARMDLDSHGANLVLMLPRAGTSTTLNVATGGSAGLSGSTARVTLTPSSLVDAGSRLAASGTVKVSLTAIDLAAQPGALPGGYRIGEGRTIESFGAIQVKLSDAVTGKPLQLAEGKTATIRIPVKTRTGELPANIQLYYFKDGASGWVQEGGALLQGDATNGYYYEGTVSHFSTWSANRAIAGTVAVRGCVRDANNGIPTGPVSIVAEGLDYSGQTQANMAADGSFELALKPNARAQLVAHAAQRNSPSLTPAPSSTDTDLREQCLILSTPPAQIEITQQASTELTVLENSPVLLKVNARAAGPLRYQWRRDEADLPGQNAPVLALRSVGLNDNGAKFSVVVGSGNSVLTRDFILKVKPLVNQTPLQTLKTLSEGLAMVLPLSLSAATTVKLGLNLSMLSRDQACSTGTVETLRLAGKDVEGGEKLPWDVTHQIDATFAACTPKFITIPELNDSLTGSMTSSFRLSGDLTLVGATEMNGLTDNTRGLRVSGRFDAFFGFTGLMVTPTAGATLTHLTSKGGGNTLTITGGQVEASLGAVHTSGSVTFHDLRFVLHGVPYVISGTFSLPGQATDKVVLQTADKQAIAQLLFDAATMTPRVEITGEVPAF